MTSSESRGEPQAAQANIDDDFVRSFAYRGGSLPSRNRTGPFVADGRTDNGPIFNDHSVIHHVRGGGAIYLPPGEIMLGEQIQVPRYTQLIGAQANGHDAGTTLRAFTDRFFRDGNWARATADGEFWRFQMVNAATGQPQPASRHGVKPGNVIATSMFPRGPRFWHDEGFNRDGIWVLDLEGPDGSVIRCPRDQTHNPGGSNPIPGGNGPSLGRVNLPLVCLGRPERNAPGTLLSHLVIGARSSNVGIGGVHASGLQEMGGLWMVTVSNPRWKAFYIGNQGSTPAEYRNHNEALNPSLNYQIEHIRSTSGADIDDVEWIGYDEWNGTVSPGVTRSITISGTRRLTSARPPEGAQPGWRWPPIPNWSSGNTPAPPSGDTRVAYAAMRFNGGGQKQDLHPEGAVYGIAIGDKQAPTAAITVDGVGGSSSVNWAVWIGTTPVGGTFNHSVTVRAVSRNNSQNGCLRDERNGNEVVPSLGLYLLDRDGRCRINTNDPAAMGTLPRFGSAGQVLAKASGADFDAAWISVDGGGGPAPAALPPACIMAYAGATVPEGWLLCDGAVLSRNRYPDLFDALGHTYGGTGDDFRLPDFTDRFPRGNTRTPAAGSDAHSHNLDDALNWAQVGGGVTTVQMPMGAVTVPAWTDARRVDGATVAGGGANRTGGVPLGGDTASGPAVPAYVGVIYIIKT